jgi:hypothetical protein
MSVTEMVLPNKQTQSVFLTRNRGSLFRIRTATPTVLTKVQIFLCPYKNSTLYIEKKQF